MTQIAAELLGLPLEDVTFKLGDSSLPEAPVEGGSFTAASVGSAVKAACEKVAEDAVRARAEGRRTRRSPAPALDDVDVRGRADPPARRPVAVRLPRRGDAAAARSTSSRRRRPPSRARSRSSYSRYTHSAVFAEVEVDEDFGTVRVTRVVSAIAGGPHPQPEDGAEPGPGRHRLGHRHRPCTRRACSTTPSAGS